MKETFADSHNHLFEIEVAETFFRVSRIVSKDAAKSDDLPDSIIFSLASSSTSTTSGNNPAVDITGVGRGSPTIS